MDKDRRQAQEQLLARALATHPNLAWEVLEEPHRANGGLADALLRLRYGDREWLYMVEVKPGLRPATVGPTLIQLARLGPRALLVTDHVTPQLADKLRAEGVAFLDTAGNAYLDAPPLLVWVKGQRPPEKPAPPAAGRAFKAKGLQVVFALLCEPELLRRPYREIARFAGVAHGTVGEAIADLEQAGFVRDFGRDGGRRLHKRRRLLDAWVEAYARTLRPKLLLGRFRAQEPAWWEKVDFPRYQAQLGGEPAAARLTRYLHPATTTLYANTMPTRLLADHRLVRDAQGDVELLRKFWTFETQWAHTELTPPVLIYADLLATGEARCIETAHRVDEAYLAELLEPD